MRKKKKTKGKSGDPGPVTTSCWPLYDVLHFLRETVRHKRYVARSNIINTKVFKCTFPSALLQIFRGLLLPACKFFYDRVYMYLI